MALAPDRELRACMRVIYHAALDARMAGWNGDVDARRLADLMDAIHNIPSLVQNWESCDENLLKSKLLDYERKWRSEGPCLRAIYEQAIEQDI
jgi:hypothetical protein